MNYNSLSILYESRLKSMYDKKIPFSEIILYHIIIYQPFLKIFKRNKIEYMITYSISDDRIIFRKIEKNKLKDEHHTKKDYNNSIQIMEDIKERYKILYKDEILSNKICFIYKKFGDCSKDKYKLSLIKKLLNDKLNKLANLNHLN